MKYALVSLALIASFGTGWLARPLLPTPPTTNQYELPRYPSSAYWEHKQLDTVEWQMCQLGQKFYCAIQAGDDHFTAHLKAEGRYYSHP